MSVEMLMAATNREVLPHPYSSRIIPLEYELSKAPRPRASRMQSWLRSTLNKRSRRFPPPLIRRTARSWLMRLAAWLGAR